MKLYIPFDQMKKLFGGSHIVEQNIPLIAPSTILGILHHGTEDKIIEKILEIHMHKVTQHDWDWDILDL